MLGIIGVDFMMKLCPKVVIAVYFDATVYIFVDTEERKCGILSGGGVEGAHATDSICGSR